MPEGKDIIDIKVGFPGPTADINLFREQQVLFDGQQTFEGDKGYQGGKILQLLIREKGDKN